jgi:hypothetical protein
MSQKLDILKTAIKNNEFFLFLTGKKRDYYFACPYADMPTDPDQAFDAIKEYFYENEEWEIWSKFQEKIIEMTEDEEDVWLSIYYLSMYLSFRDYKKINFIDLKLTVEKIEEGLNKNRSLLLKNKKWGGDQFSEGLWGDVKRLVNIINNKFNININVE